MVKLFTHIDLDGIGCAVLAKLAFREVDIEYCNYDDINTKADEFLHNSHDYDFVFITDISITDELASYVDVNFDNFVLLDHHPTALELNKYKWCEVKIEDENTSIKTSGTELFFTYLMNNKCLPKDAEIESFVEIVRNYDTWRWATLGDSGIICKQINDLLYLYGRDKFVSWCIEKITVGVFPELSQIDNLLLDMKQKEIDEYVDRKSNELFTYPMCGHVCGFVFAERYFSELGNRLCQMHPEIDFVAMIDIVDGTVSYRTVKEDINLGKDVAKLFGGGGHPKAAGSQFSKEIQLNLIEKIFYE